MEAKQFQVSLFEIFDPKAANSIHKFIANQKLTKRVRLKIQIELGVVALQCLSMTLLLEIKVTIIKGGGEEW